MITGRQIRAAKALLEWSAEDLAREAGLTRVTVSKIESETVQPQAASMEAIMAVFDRNGVEFLPDEGVRIRKHQLRVFSGKAGYRQLLDHIYETVKAGGCIRQFNHGDAKYLTYAESYAEAHMERMAEIKDLDARVLSLASEENFDAPYCTYRVLDRRYQALAPYYIYGDYLIMAMHEAGYKKEILSVQSRFLVDQFLKQFDFFWKQSQSSKKR